MKRFTIVMLSVLMLIALSASPLAALAQDVDMEDWVEFEAGEGLLTLSHPEDWIAELDINQGGIIIANSEEARAAMDGDEGPGEGQVAVLLAFLPAEFAGFMGIELTDDMEPDALVTALAESMMADSEDEENPTEVGEPMLLELSEDREVGAVEIQDDEVKGILTAWVADDLIIIGVYATHPDSFEEYQDTALGIISTFAVNGTAEDVTKLFEEAATATE